MLHLCRRIVLPMRKIKTTNIWRKKKLWGGKIYEVIMGNLIESKAKTTWGCPLIQPTKSLREFLTHVHNNFIKHQVIVNIYSWRLTQHNVNQNNDNFHKSKHICDSMKAHYIYIICYIWVLASVEVSAIWIWDIIRF